jgi:hypothetical protein
MARKTLTDLKPSSKQRDFGKLAEILVNGMDERARHANSWAVVGMDTSMSSIALTAIGYDALMGKLTKVKWAQVRWLAEDDYFKRINDAAMIHMKVLDVLPIGLNLDRVYIFQEEPVPLGMMRSGRGTFESGWVKQQCEISGAVLGSLTRWGYSNIWQINNQQWKKVLRNEGVTISKMPEGKWNVKEWAIQAYGLPDLPDLVKGKTGGKVPRPVSGYGAKAKAVQPDDVYDAAACMAFGVDFVREMVEL